MESPIRRRRMRPPAEQAEHGRAVLAKEAPELDGRHFAAMWHLQALGHLIGTEIDRIARPHGLSGADLLLLGALRIGEARRAADLATQMHLSQAVFSARVGRLVDRGLVRRSRSVTDRRAFELALTETGAPIVDILIGTITERGHFAGAYRSLDQQDRDAGSRILGALHDYMHRHVMPGSAR